MHTRWNWAAVLAILSVMALATPSTALGGVSWLIDSFTETREAGQSFTVSGSGCPQTGEFPTPDGALRLRLTPPGGGNEWYPVLLAGDATVFSTDQGVPGETDVSVAPNLDGTFTANITIPAGSPAGENYSVRGICLTVLQSGLDGPGGFSQASYDASFGQAGSLTVEAAPTTSSSLSTTTAAPIIPVQPAFTG